MLKRVKTYIACVLVRLAIVANYCAMWLLQESNSRKVGIAVSFERDYLAWLHRDVVIAVKVIIPLS
jgi:adenine-specific DNA methylase